MDKPVSMRRIFVEIVDFIDFYFIDLCAPLNKESTGGGAQIYNHVKVVPPSDELRTTSYEKSFS